MMNLAMNLLADRTVGGAVYDAVNATEYWAVNLLAERTVDEAMYWAVHAAVIEAVDLTLAERRAVNWAVNRPVYRAVGLAVYQAVFRDQPHPGLNFYLKVVRG